MATVLPILVSRPMVPENPDLNVSTVIGSHSDTYETPQRQAQTNPTESDRIRPLAASSTLSHNTEMTPWEVVTTSVEPIQENRTTSSTQELDHALEPLSRFLRSARRTDWVLPQVTADDVDNQLRSYYRQNQWMEQVTALACLQVVPVTFMVLLGITVDDVGRVKKALLVTLSYSTNILLLQPFNCLFAVLFDLISHEEHPFRKQIFGLPVTVWFLLLIAILPFPLFEGVGYDIAKQLERFAYLGVLLFVAPQVAKILGNVKSACHGVINAWQEICTWYGWK